jgi:hypothetical protein
MLWIWLPDRRRPLARATRGARDRVAGELPAESGQNMARSSGRSSSAAICSAADADRTMSTVPRLSVAHEQRRTRVLLRYLDHPREARRSAIHQNLEHDRATAAGQLPPDINSGRAAQP